MAATWMNEGLIQALKGILDPNGSFPNLALRLFDSAHAPVVTDTFATYQAIQTTAAGYTGQAIYGAAPTVTAAGGVASAAPVVLTFSFSAYGGGDVSIFGYYVSWPAATKVYCAEQFAVPFVIPHGGGDLLVVPSFTLRKLV